MASKGPRSTNWNSNEKNVLLGLITEVIDIIENKKTDFLANNAKHQAWQQVLSGFSATFGKTRELKELKDQWKRSKQIAKKEWQGKKDHVRGTGGGPPAPQISATTSTVMGLCPRDFVSIKSDYDDDADTPSVGTVSANDFLHASKETIKSFPVTFTASTYQGHKDSSLLILGDLAL